MLVFRAVIHKMLVRLANMEDPGQSASSDVDESSDQILDHSLCCICQHGHFKRCFAHMG